MSGDDRASDLRCALLTLAAQEAPPSVVRIFVDWCECLSDLGAGGFDIIDHEAEEHAQMFYAHKALFGRVRGLVAKARGGSGT